MRVLMLNRPDALTAPGGDTVQMLKTQAALRELGVEVETSLASKPDVDRFDVVHVFNAQAVAMPHAWEQVLYVKQRRKPLALSPIYYDSAEQDAWQPGLLGPSGLRSRLATYLARVLARRFRIDLFRGGALDRLCRRERQEARRRVQQEVALRLVDILLPNGTAELECLRRDFPSLDVDAHVVPNAADEVFYGATPDDFARRVGQREFVLSVGRLEHTKNQLALIRALRGTGLALVIIGRVADPAYARRCRSEADAGVTFMDEVSHEDLAPAYAAAKVHALPSWRETPGLANLEAGLAGCNLAITTRGTTREYFGDYAWYCDPNDVASIREAVLAALRAPRRPELAEHIRSHYTWRRAAEETLVAYRRLLGGSGGAVADAT